MAHVECGDAGAVRMRVIGIDPGTRRLGWGIVERAGTRLHHVAHGTLVLRETDLADRLVRIDEQLQEIIDRQPLSAAAIESMFFGKNAQSAVKLGHARGVAMLSLRRAGLTVAEYTPTRVKRAVAGSGRASKGQIVSVVKSILTLPEAPQEDAADALAVAITHANVAAFDEARLRR